MKRHLNEHLWSEWVSKVGGLSAATLRIIEKLECSSSKAEKLASGRYPSLPTASEQKDLAQIVKVKRDLLFPLAQTGEGQAS